MSLYRMLLVIPFSILSIKTINWKKIKKVYILQKKGKKV